MVGRFLLVFALVSTFSIPHAAAQTSIGSTGFVTASFGGAGGGDVADRRWTPGLSIAVVGETGIGAELDLSRVSDFNNALFADSRITSAMLNVTGIWKDAAALVRPYAVAGMGLLQSRVCVIDCQVESSYSEFGFDVGGGVLVLWNETIGARGDVRYFQSFQQPQDGPYDGYLNFWRTSIGVTISWPIR